MGDGGARVLMGDGAPKLVLMGDGGGGLWSILMGDGDWHGEGLSYPPIILERPCLKKNIDCKLCWRCFE
jgi:hypothetical protein